MLSKGYTPYRTSLSLSVLNANQGDKEKNLLATLDKINLSSLLEIRI